MSLAEWLIKYNKEKEKEKDNSLNNTMKCGSNETCTNIIDYEPEPDQLFRSFSYIEIFKENGAEVFRQLRMDRSFRLFPSDKRGKLLAYLLYLYKPIMTMKEECAFNLEDDYQKLNDSIANRLVHYTKLQTLKHLLSSDYDNPSEPLKQENTENEPRFRLSNCGYMNDIKEGHTMLSCMETVLEQLHKEKETQKPQYIIDRFQHLVSKYFPDLKHSNVTRQPNGSNIYIGCLSVKPDSFSMGTVYSANETGCTIEFDENFFDIRGVAYRDDTIRDYLPPFFTDQDYPLYNINYIGHGFKAECEKLVGDNREKIWKKDPKEWFLTQKCHTRSIKYERLFCQIEEIYKRWDQTDEFLKSLIQNEEKTGSPEQTVRRFITDRLNEVRFLFKNSDYEFESEIRVIYIDSNEKQCAMTDRSSSDPASIPLVYVNVERDIKNLTITLGSHIEDSDVNRIVAWLNHTGRVKDIQLAQRNRLSGENSEIFFGK